LFDLPPEQPGYQWKKSSKLLTSEPIRMNDTDKEKLVLAALGNLIKNDLISKVSYSMSIYMCQPSRELHVVPTLQREVVYH
jgi:hypothetical protein